MFLFAFAGWKANPVEFDSVFNQSWHTISYGSPDIVPIFCGALPHSTWNTFMTMKTLQLSLLNRSNEDLKLKELLLQDNRVISLHLLGCDSNGHAHRLFSSIYLNNVKVVDHIAKLDEHAHNTPTPKEWGLNGIERVDFNQADIAPIMSTLLGLPCSVNSVGNLPLEYIKMNEVSSSNEDEFLVGKVKAHTATPPPLVKPPKTTPTPVSPHKSTPPPSVSPPKSTPPPLVSPPKATPPSPVSPPKTTPPPPVSPLKTTPPPPPVSPPKTIPPTVSLPLPPATTKKDCLPLCGERCKLHSRKNLCVRACVTCCDRCKCVPPGTYGNRELCGRCYTDMTTRNKKPKCP
ncbi:hypothetical protein Patl1_21933 [Pistacia atlantica]|uniref:Uncharacterized protein n=1 Tax=Pistacia atlantica TaxID=434234 RepID=A0ACC1BHN7_9ROSI|nr:hypothetical protein Patl1_21933 [Pistacia atlantica]